MEPSESPKHPEQPGAAAPTLDGRVHASGPSASHQSSRARASAMARELQASDARRDSDDNRLHITADSMRMSVNHRYTRYQAPIASFEWDLHDLWHTYYLASRHISAEHPAQDRLVRQLVALREQGVLTRPSTTNPGTATTTGDAEREEALTAGGLIWSDLPFLAADMTGYWVTAAPQMSAAQRLNYSYFLARLASVSAVANDQLCSIGLVILRDALETARPLGRLEEEEESEDAYRRMQDLSTAALLPSANAWLYEVGSKLVALSDGNWNHCAPEVGTTGELFESSAAGFSAIRWLYWLGRLEEIASSAAATQSPALSAYASKMVGNMMSAADEADPAGAVARAVREARGSAHARQ